MEVHGRWNYDSLPGSNECAEPVGWRVCSRVSNALGTDAKGFFTSSGWKMPDSQKFVYWLIGQAGQNLAGIRFHTSKDPTHDWQKITNHEINKDLKGRIRVLSISCGRVCVKRTSFNPTTGLHPESDHPAVNSHPFPLHSSSSPHVQFTFPALVLGSFVAFSAKPRHGRGHARNLVVDLSRASVGSGSGAWQPNPRGRGNRVFQGVEIRQGLLFLQPADSRQSGRDPGLEFQAARSGYFVATPAFREHLDLSAAPREFTNGSHQAEAHRLQRCGWSGRAL